MTTWVSRRARLCNAALGRVAACRRVSCRRQNAASARHMTVGHVGLMQKLDKGRCDADGGARPSLRAGWKWERPRSWSRRPAVDGEVGLDFDFTWRAPAHAARAVSPTWSSWTRWCGLQAGRPRETAPTVGGGDKLKRHCSRLFTRSCFEGRAPWRKGSPPLCPAVSEAGHWPRQMRASAFQPNHRDAWVVQHAT